MALIECPDCHSRISESAPTCPHCGRPAGRIQKPPIGKAKPFWRPRNILLLVAAGYVLAMLTIWSGEPAQTGADSTATKYPKPGPTDFVDSTLLAQCESLVQNCVNKRVLGRIEYSTISKVQARPLFEAFEYEQKLGVAKALSYVAKSHGFDGHVKFRDSGTNATVGMYNALTGTLDWNRR